MTKKQVLLEILRYLNHRLDNCDNGYEWKELCGLVCSIEDTFNIKRIEHNPSWHEDSQIEPKIETWDEH